MGFRTLKVTPEKLVGLLREISLGHDIRLFGAPLPRDVALSTISYDASARLFSIELVARDKDWPDPGPDTTFAYAVRCSDSGAATDWSAPIALGPADA